MSAWAWARKQDHASAGRKGSTGVDDGEERQMQRGRKGKEKGAGGEWRGRKVTAAASESAWVRGRKLDRSLGERKGITGVDGGEERQTRRGRNGKGKGGNARWQGRKGEQRRQSRRGRGGGSRISCRHEAPASAAGKRGRGRRGEGRGERGKNKGEKEKRRMREGGGGGGIPKNRDGNGIPSLFRDGKKIPSLFRDGKKKSVSI